MREFIVTAHTAALSHRFELNDLPGSAGRMDVLCRCVTAAFLTSHNLRDDVRVQFVLQNKFVVRFEGSELKRVNPDERSTGSLFQKVLERRHIAERTGDEFESTPGIYISARTLDDVLEKADRRGSVILLREDGTRLSEFKPPDHPIFVLSDHTSFEPEETERITAVADHHISISPRALHTHQSITIMHHYLDTNGYVRFVGNSE